MPVKAPGLFPTYAPTRPNSAPVAAFPGREPGGALAFPNPVGAIVPRVIDGELLPPLPTPRTSSPPPPPIDVDYVQVPRSPSGSQPITAPSPNLPRSPSPSPSPSGSGGFAGAGLGLVLDLGLGVPVGGAVGGLVGGLVGGAIGNLILPGAGGVIGGFIGQGIGGAVGAAVQEGMSPTHSPVPTGGAVLNFPPNGIFASVAYIITITRSTPPLLTTSSPQSGDMVSQTIRDLTVGSSFGANTVTSITVRTHSGVPTGSPIPYVPPTGLPIAVQPVILFPFPVFPPPFTYPSPNSQPRPAPLPSPQPRPDPSPLPSNPSNPAPQPLPLPFTPPSPSPSLPPSPSPQPLPIPRPSPSPNIPNPSPSPSPSPPPSPFPLPSPPPPVPPKQNPPRNGDCCDCPPCPELEDKNFRVDSSVLGGGDSGTFSLPSGSFLVFVDVTTVGSQVRSQSGNGEGQDIYFLGSYAEGALAGFGDRNPISYERNTYEISELSTSFTYQLNYGSLAVVTAYYRTEI